MAKRTRSPHPLLSSEVRWYLETRGYSLDGVTEPLIRTPEPVDVPGAVFDPVRVDKKITALRSLKHTKGKWAGRPLEPAAVQVAYIIAPVFGWVAPDEDGDLVRIIRELYVEEPRKSAKTTLASGLGMTLAFADDEPGAEVLFGAASRDQAQAAFAPLEQLARTSPLLQKAGVRATKKVIAQSSSGSSISTVSSVGELAHGKNPHGYVLDELHVHKNGKLLEALESGTGARSQPLGIIITTADDGQTTSVYAQKRRFIEDVAAGTISAPATYGVIFAASEKDDPYAETTWAKACPLYPVTPSPAFMRAAADKARANPVALASFLRLHLGIRASTDRQYLDLTKWDRASGWPIDEEALAGRLAYGGLDLAAVSDLTALVWLLPDGPAYDVLCRFWLPEAAVSKLDASTNQNASAWVDEGWITTTPGDVTDYDFIQAQILADMDTFDVAGLGCDPWNATQTVNNLQAEGVPVESVRQGYQTLSGPLKELDRLVRTGKKQAPLWRHGGNPVLRWMAGNLRPRVDPNGNVAPDKARSIDKIDGISAAVTALSVALNATPEAAGEILF
jgi:phage terminase large subunit-like protein